MTELNPIDHIFLVVIVLLWPLYVATYRFPHLKRDIAAGRVGARIKAYGEGAALEWMLLAALLLLWFAAGRTSEALGLTLSGGWQLWLGAVVVVVVIVLLTMQRRKILNDETLQEQLRKSIANVSPLLPSHRSELRVFYGLSVTAGICEEILYRGFVMWYITQVTGLVGGVVLSSALFGLAHAYQGTRGMLQTGAVGLVLAIIYVLSGTLWIPIFLHAFLDINSGHLAYGIREPEPAEDMPPLHNVDGDADDDRPEDLS